VVILGKNRLKLFFSSKLKNQQGLPSLSLEQAKINKAESYGAFIYKCISNLLKRFRNSRTEGERYADDLNRAI